MERDGRIW